MLLGTSALFLALLAFYTQRPGHLSHSWLPTAYSGPFTLLRGQFLASVSGVTEDSAGLVAGLAIGDTSRLSSLTSDTMKVVSLTHLTAVSGANCAIVVGAIYLILRRTELVRWLRISFSLAGLVIYVLIVGPEPSVLRAAVMAGIVAGLAVMWTSPLGKSALGFVGDSVAEAKRVVWPTRKETIQTTIAVFVLVLIMAAFLAVVDIGFAYMVQWLMGRSA